MKAIETDDEPVKRLEMKTTRLALQNYDWSSLNARELYFLFDSHLKNSGFKEKFTNAENEASNGLKSVKVYMSDFGEQRMQEEKAHGPKRVFEELKEKYGKSGGDEESVREMIQNDPVVRQYEIERLKYYYSVLDFETQEIADWVYSHCDGLEFEKSGMQIDLRGVPQDLQIPKAPCEEASGVKGLDVQTLKKKKIKNLPRNHTHVELTWGAGRSNQNRTRRTRRSCLTRSCTKSKKAI